MSHTDDYSPAAAGFTAFAAVIMIISGFFSALTGLGGIFENEFWTIVPAIGTEEQGDAYVLALDATTWGWIHLILGLLVGFAGVFLLRGATWARVIGVILATLSAIVNFAWLPWYPVWAIVVIAVDIAIIWALTAHGRDIAQP